MKEIFSLIGSLVLIIAVLVFTYYATRWYARRMGKTSSGRYIKVLDRTILGTGASAVIVVINDTYYLLGVGDKTVSLLCELPDFVEQDAADLTAPGPIPDAFRQMLDKAKEGFGKKDGDGRRD